MWVHTLTGSAAAAARIRSSGDFGIAHTFETYDGDHTNRVVERIEQKVLPFFSKNLNKVVRLKPDTTVALAWARRLLPSHAWKLVRGSLRFLSRSSFALAVGRPTTQIGSPHPFNRPSQGKPLRMSALMRGRTRTSAIRAASMRQPG